MKLFSQVITDENDIYIYFEIIRQLKPKSILDVGMTLKRMGAVSRQAMHCEIPRDTLLDGIDWHPEVDFPIYKEIYSGIYQIDQISDKNYDLVTILDAQNYVNEYVLDCISKHSETILFDADEEICRNYFVLRYECQAIQFENRTFGLTQYRRG